ncbi:hypothetical protein OROMI_024664 [Orobanche minor]
MASSQASQSMKKRDHIIDGRLFSRSTVLDRIESETEDVHAMEAIISKLELQNLLRLGRSQTDLYDEQIVEDFFRDASVKLFSRNHGGGVSEVSATVKGVQICINSTLLSTMFGLPSKGLTMEELETFGSEELLTAYWGLFTGDSSNTKVHPSCNKKNFCLPFVYLHDFCCRIIENRTGAFESCTNLRFRMMIAILYGQQVNWCQIVLKRLSEEVTKPSSQKKSFGLLLNNILTRSGVPLSRNAKKIGSGKYIGGFKPTAFNRAGLSASRPFLSTMPSLKRNQERSDDREESSRKRKRSVSDSMSSLTAKKKQKKAAKPTAQPADHPAQGATSVEDQPASAAVPPKQSANMSDQHIFADLANLDESAAHLKSIISSPVRVPIPEQDPDLTRVPSPIRIPSPNRVPTPVRDPSPIQAPIPVEDPNPTENPIPVRSPSPQVPSFSEQIEQAFTRFVKWKSYRTAPYDILLSWPELKDEEQFVMEVTDSKDILLLIQWDNQQCKELIFSHYLDQNPRLNEQGQARTVPPVQPSADHGESSRAIPHEDSGPLPEQATAERQQDPIPVTVSSDSEDLHHAAASSSIRHPNSPRTEARKEQLNSLGRQSVFLQDAVEALYKVGKEMDWLNLTAKEEMESVKGELFKIAEVFQTLPQDLKEAFAKFDQLEEQNLLEEQSKLRVVESKTVAVLEYTDSRISDHDIKIDNMAKFIISLDQKLAKFEEQQENVLNVLRNIVHTVSELNARKGEDEGNHDANRESARRSQDQGSRSEHESSRMSSSRHRA